jgi:hypothetical protein
MSGPTRKSIFEEAARNLRRHFDELGSIPHNGSRGSEAESLIRAFLNSHLPKRFCASSGFILDAGDQVSKQTDVVVYDALHCPVFRASKDTGIFPSDNVAAIIEVKSRLTKRELKDAFEKIESVKRLSKTAPKLPAGPTLTQTMGVVFAFTSALSLKTIAAEYVQLSKHIDIRLHPNLIVVLDRGLIAPIAKQANAWNPHISLDEQPPLDAEGMPIGVAGYQLGQATLDHFLRLLVSRLALFRSIISHPGFEWQAPATAFPLGVMRLAPGPRVNNESDALVGGEGGTRPSAASPRPHLSRNPKRAASARQRRSN